MLVFARCKKTPRVLVFNSNLYVLFYMKIGKYEEILKQTLL